MKNDKNDLINFWENKKIPEYKEKKEIKKEKDINFNININNYEIKEKNNPLIWILIQIGLNFTLVFLLFYIDTYLFLFVLILNFVVFWCYTVYKILKYDFKYNKLVWILICIFLPFLSIFFPAFEDDIIIKEEQKKCQ